MSIFRRSRRWLPGSSALLAIMDRTIPMNILDRITAVPYLSYWYRLPYACGVYGYC